MSLPLIMLLAVSFFELLLLAVVLVFFIRLRRSESLLNTLQQRQEDLLKKLHFNTELEQELVLTFEKRQSELARLDEQLENRAQELEGLLKQAEQISRSPRFLREVILQGKRKGKSVQALSISTGLSVDEVELILEQAGF